MPGDQVYVDDPYLIVNGERVKESGFQKVMAAVNGYNGYVVPRQFNADDFIQAGREPDGSPNFRTSTVGIVPPDTYLPMGDNSRYSLDGRNFGPVREKNLLGPALVVYWPFLPHFGLIR